MKCLNLNSVFLLTGIWPKKTADKKPHPKQFFWTPINTQLLEGSSKATLKDMSVVGKPRTPQTPTWSRTPRRPCHGRTGAGGGSHWAWRGGRWPCPWCAGSARWWSRACPSPGTCRRRCWSSDCQPGCSGPSGGPGHTGERAGIAQSSFLCSLCQDENQNPTHSHRFC